jgi:hypothetical protein
LPIFFISPEKHLSERSRQKLHFQPKTSSLPGITEYSTLTKSISNREILLLWILNPRTKISDWENVSELLDERTNERCCIRLGKKYCDLTRSARLLRNSHITLSVCMFVCPPFYLWSFVFFLYGNPPISTSETISLYSFLLASFFYYFSCLIFLLKLF